MKKTTPLPFRLRRSSLHIFPTPYGFLFIGVLVVMLIGSINYNNNLGFVLVFLLGSMGLISMVHSYRNVLGLEILSVVAVPVFAGDVAVFNLLIRAKRTNRTAVAMTFEQGDAVVGNIPDQTQVQIDITIATQKRGILQVGPLTIESLFPFGLFRVWSILNPDARCCVYPKPLPVSSIPAEGQGSLSANGRKEDRGVDDFTGLKTYRPGDPIRHIAWKSLSRGLGVFSKDFDAEGRGPVIFDYETVRSEDPEKKLSFICSMILTAQRMQVKYGLRLPGTLISPDHGNHHRHRCLKALALFGSRDSV